METASTTHEGTIFAGMREDHAMLERALHVVLVRAHVNDGEGLRDAFGALDAELRAHLMREERDLLPRFETFCPGETAAIRRDHDHIRCQLDALGIDLDLHTLRAHQVDQFVAMLHEHAAREEKELYEWADQALSEREKRPLLDWISARVEARVARLRARDRS